MQDFGFAQKEKMTRDHDVIDDAIREKAVGYTVFSIPVGMVYRPNEAKVKNLKTKDYLGKARLIATSNSQNTTTGFTGADRQERLRAEIAAKDDRPSENISYAATNLVQRNLSSRGGREQSAPPAMNRNMFPPTPPPETEKPVMRTSTGSNSGLTNDRSLPFRTSSMRNTDRNIRPPPSRKQYEEPPRPGMLGRSATYDQNPRAQPALGQRPQPDYTSARENSWPQEPRDINIPPMNKPRLGTIRTASEPRGPSTRQQYLPNNYPSRSTSTRTGPSAPTPAPLFGERERTTTSPSQPLRPRPRRRHHRRRLRHVPTSPPRSPTQHTPPTPPTNIHDRRSRRRHLHRRHRHDSRRRTRSLRTRHPQHPPRPPSQPQCRAHTAAQPAPPAPVTSPCRKSASKSTPNRPMTRDT